MKREQLLVVVEKAVERTMRNLMQSHPEALQGDLARSIEKRQIGMFGSELLLAMGHKPGTKLRALGDEYKPSKPVRQRQRLPKREM